MRRLIAFLVLVLGFGGSTAALAARVTKELAAPPPGATLPVMLQQTLKPHKVQAGQAVRARLMQRVPVSSQIILPAGAELDGRVVAVSDSAISILFERLRWKGQALPVHVRLVAAAAPMNVFQAGLPLGATDRSTSNPGDWTTRQVGGDEVYLSAGAGKVYDRYSEPVGFANFSGVYASPSAPGELPRAMGPFSTTATGLHGFSDLSIASPGGAGKPITLAANKPKWQIRNGSALLLEVVQ